MKRSLLTLLMAFMITLLCKGVTNPDLIYWQSDYRNSSTAQPLGDWTCHGAGKTAQEVEIGESGIMLNDLFPEGSPAYIPMDFDDFGLVYISNSTTVEGGAADEWLISPAIDLSGCAGNAILAFDVFAYGNSGSPKYEIYVSTTGCEPEDFDTPVYAGKGNSSGAYPVCERKYIALNDIDGDQVYLAFVNKSRNAQILGFKDITLSEYELDMVNSTPAFFTDPQDVGISILVSAMTPVAANGFTATLTYGDEEQVQTSTTPLSGSIMTTRIDFPTPIPLALDDNINYTITITPDYEGATPSVFHSNIACSEGFDPVCVMEETTATWCGYCVRGTAAMNLMKQRYGHQFIGIAIHGSSDPMHLPSYLDPLLAQSGIGGYPSAWYNRSIQEDPMTPELVEQLLTERSGYTVAIKEVTIEPDADNLVSVRYAPRLAFSTSGANLTAVAIVTEDDVQGDNSGYNQTNYYSGVLQTDVEEAFGADAWPFFQPYAEGGSVLPYPLMSYNHVARGIFNNYHGEGEGAELPGEWTVNEEQEFTISFELPMSENVGTSGVDDWKNTNIVVLLLDKMSGKVLSAAEMNAADYTEVSSVAQMGFAGNVKVTRNEGIITVSSDDSFDVNIYNLQGYRLYSSHSIEGEQQIDASGFSGPVVVRVSSGNDTYIKKYIF